MLIAVTHIKIRKGMPSVKLIPAAFEAMTVEKGLIVELMVPIAVPK